MAGHSKWAKVKRIKAVKDPRRSKVFSRLTREITIAAKAGGGDPAMNPRLRTILMKAREANMPTENIDRAVKKGTGDLPGVVFEETIYDKRNGKPLNNNFADYLVSTNADIPDLECVFVEYPDLHLNEYGARGIGEIGLAGVASALTMAVYHATGVRVRKLPVRIEDLLAGEQKVA